MNDTIAGNITYMFDILNVAIPQSRSGRVRALAVTSGKRSPYLPEVPTMEEAGVPGYSAAGSDLWFGIMAPAGIPKEALDRLHVEIVKALNTADLRERLSLTMLFISHDLSVVRQFADTVTVLQHGVVKEDGPTAQVFADPADDYTRALVASIPDVARTATDLPVGAVR